MFIETPLTQKRDVGLDHPLHITIKEEGASLHRIKKVFHGAENMDVVLELRDHTALGKAGGVEKDEAGDLVPGEAQITELGNARGESVVDLAAEQSRIAVDGCGDVVGRETEAGEEGAHGVRLGWGLKVGEPLRDLADLVLAEAAGGDEVVLDGEGGGGRRHCGGRSGSESST